MNTRSTIQPDAKTPFRFLKAVEINPKDDAFHGNIHLLDIEWWYFDAVFDNGYSIHIGLRTYHIRNSGIIQSRITIYKDGETVVEDMKPTLFSNLNISSETPNIKINTKPVMEFDCDQYKRNGQWSYHITLSINNNAVDLKFTGTTKGWKIETLKTCWAVALPKATVQGTITIEGKEIPVKGIGYHDHNWSYSITTAASNIGWFWGRVTGDTLNITWSRIYETEDKGDLLAIVNQDKKQAYNNPEFYNIPPSAITFIPKKFKQNHKKLIPTEFELVLSNQNKDNQPSIKSIISMKTHDVQYTRIFTIHYWRYHVKTNGTITVGSTTEILKDKLQIIEFLSFKS